MRRERACEARGRGGGRSSVVRLFSITWHQNGNGGLPASFPGHLLSKYTNTETFKVKVSVQLLISNRSTPFSALLDVCVPITDLYQSNFEKEDWQIRENMC